MTTAAPGRSPRTYEGQPVGLADLPRAVLSAAVGVMSSVERAVAGKRPIRTARGNAWEAICADRARAYERDEVRRIIAAIVHDGHASVVPGERTTA